MQPARRPSDASHVVCKSASIICLLISIVLSTADAIDAQVNLGRESFGSVIVGSSSSRVLGICYNGSESADIDLAFIGGCAFGPDESCAYSISFDGCSGTTLSPSNRCCFVGVNFTPTAAGFQDAILYFDSSDIPGGSAFFDLEGIGLESSPPVTTITSGPSGTVTTRNVTFQWTASDDTTPPSQLRYAFRLDPIEPSFSTQTTQTS